MSFEIVISCKKLGGKFHRLAKLKKDQISIYEFGLFCIQSKKMLIALVLPKKQIRFAQNLEQYRLLQNQFYIVHISILSRDKKP